MTYYLSKIQGIHKIVPATALHLGSAVHHGLAENVIELDDIYDEYCQEQAIAEGILSAYFDQKSSIYSQILNNDRFVTEEHELHLEANLPSASFHGFIDLLVITDHGATIVDYKTTSREPNWDDYTDQLLRYTYLCQENGINVDKIAILNLRKIGIRQKQSESDIMFYNRIKSTYQDLPAQYVIYHEFDKDLLSQSYMDRYIYNLDIMCQEATKIIETKNYYINYAEANGKYRSEYYEIFYNMPDAEVLYEIEDTIPGIEEPKRQCVPIDMKTIEYTDQPDIIINKYDIYATKRRLYNNDNTFHNWLTSNFITDDSLLAVYDSAYINAQKS